MEMLNGIGFSIDHFGRLLVTGSQLGFAPLIIMLWDHLFN